MAAVLVITLTQASGAAGTSPGAADTFSHQARELTAYPRAAPEQTGAAKRGAKSFPRTRGNCPSARKAVKFYAGRIAYWRSKMGAGDSLRARGQRSRVQLRAVRSACPRYLAHVLQRKAHAAHKAFIRWQRDEWHYERWMPAWMIRLAQCEMGLDWHRRAGAYEGAFAFATTTWDGYKLPGYPASAADASPRQQMNVVYRVARAVGGVGVAWGCWRGPQHAWVRGGLPESGFYG